MSHVSGSSVTKNSPTLTGETAEVDFVLPAGGVLLDVDVAQAKVSLNGNLLPSAGFVVEAKEASPRTYFEVTNAGLAAWPAVSSLVVECYYPSPVDQSIGNLLLTLDDHELRITALEAAAP